MPEASTLTKKKNCVPGIIRKVIAGWLTAVALEYWLLPSSLRDLSGLDGLSEMSMGWIIAITVGISLFLLGVDHFVANTDLIERWFIVGAFCALMIGVLISSFTPALLITCLLISAVLVIYAVLGWNGQKETTLQPEKSGKGSIWIVLGLGLIFAVFVSVWLVCRVLSFSTPAFDFGIFAQMFHYMRKTGIPWTTVEREGLLSHFAVHVSPIYYLMLPFYWIIPHPATLQVLQAVVLASSVIPLWLIAKHHGLPDWQSILLCAVLLLFPALAGGTSYDLHENCFLTPLILWMFYGIDKKNTLVTFIAAFLTLMVKEDAAVYVAVIALWMVLDGALHYDRKNTGKLWTGAALLVLSLGYFLGITAYLAHSGDGVMTYRYDNLMYDGSGSLISVVKSVILNPMKAVYECIDTEKHQFIFLTLAPLLGLPLITRRFERYILLIPYLLINLMTDYQYQYSIFFQYTFGSTAFLIYLTLINLKDLKISWVRLAALCTAVVIALGCFITQVYPKASSYPKKVLRHHERYEQMREVLDSIPEDASVAAHTFYATYLSQRYIMYDIGNCTLDRILSCEYVVFNPSYTGSEVKRYATNGEDNGAENFVAILEKNGYALYQYRDNNIAIYRKS